MAREVIIYTLILVLIFSGCVKPPEEPPEETPEQEEPLDGIPEENFPEKVDFKTEDNFKIVGNLTRGGNEAVLLLHMLASNKDSYNSLAKKLNNEGYTVLAIDSRGQGESLEENGLKRNWEEFSEFDFRNSVLDVKAAKKFLETQGFKFKTIIGASIGANIALNYSAGDSSIQQIVLLSPGLEYRGVNVEDNASKVDGSVLIVASEDDAYSFGSSRNLDGLIPNSEFKELRNAGHGTSMFSGTQLELEIVEWLTADARR